MRIMHEDDAEQVLDGHLGRSYRQPHVSAGLVGIALMGDPQMPMGEGLLDEVLTMTPGVGANESVWPQLVAYRLPSPQPAQWVEVYSLAVCFVVQGRKRFEVAGREHTAEAGDFLLFPRGMRFNAEVLEADPHRPYLSLLLHVGPETISSIVADLSRDAGPPALSATDLPAAFMSVAGPEVSTALLRFLRSLPSQQDRRVLAPLYLREIVYRLMLTDSVGQLIRAATVERSGDPVSRVIAFMRTNLAESLTVADLARYARVSRSALNDAFVGATGTGPYRYMKRLRLDRAAALLAGRGHNVSEAAHLVGYASVSHFINDFKQHFGSTPRAYAETHGNAVSLFRRDPGTGGERLANPHAR